MPTMWPPAVPAGGRKIMILDIQKKMGDVVVLEMTGRITMADCPQIESDVAELVRAKQVRVIFDLSKLKYMDSSGIGTIVMCSGKLKAEGGELRLAGATGVVDQTLKLTRMNVIVPTYASMAEALSGFSQAAKVS
jgi:anti-anti-sigma factor